MSILIFRFLLETLIYFNLVFRDWNCDVASLKLIKMRKFKSSTLEKKQERNDNETDENLKEGSIQT